jgi:UDP-N-acetylbacillosamine N-acetyltransferase
MLRKLVIWGASGHALVVADIIRSAGAYEIAGFLDDDPGRRGLTFCGSHILGGRDELKAACKDGITHAIIAVGDCFARVSMAVLARREGFDLATAIHPRAIVASDVLPGAGTVIAAGAVVNPGACLGDNVIVNTCASIDHECVIEDGAHICPGVHLAGRVRIGRMTQVGIGSAIKDRVRVGQGTVIGAGSVVVSDLPDGVVAYGVPARVVRDATAVSDD